MKHAFFVHSGITYAISLAIIEHKKIDISSVIIFSENFNNCLLPIKTISLIKSIYPYKSKLKKYNIPYYIDNYININFKDEKFVLYMQSALPNHRVFMTHKNCAGFCFFEEGFANYHKYDNLQLLSIYHHNLPWRVNLKTSLKFALSEFNKVIRGYSPRLNDLPSWPNCYANFKNVEYFCFSNFAFQGIPERKKIILSFDVLKRSDLKVNELNLDGKTIWLSDSFIETFKLPLSSYYDALEQGLSAYYSIANKPRDIIYIKFHQAESKESKERTLSFFDKLNYKYILIDTSAPMELILLHSKNCDIISYTTSLLYYASILGHNSYSFVNYFNYNNDYSIDDRFEFYWNAVKKL